MISMLMMFMVFINCNNDDDELCRMLLVTMIPMHSLATGLLKLPHLDAVHQ